MKEHFERFLGMGNATDNPADLFAYSYDASELRGETKAVLFPESEEHLRQILTYCNRTNTAITIRGNGTNTVGAAVPEGGVVVSTQGFDTIRAINVREGWVDVESGVTLHELDEALAKHDLRYPHFPLHPLTTVGSFLARNATTAHGLRYGRAADTVKQLDIMDGTGKSFTVTKDFATYTGKEGACFVIIRARLQILPRTTRSADIFLTETLGVAIARLHEILTGAEKPLGVTLLDQASATYTGLSTKYTLIVEWEGERGVARHEQYASIISKLALVKRRVGEQRYILEDDGTASHETLEQALRWCADKSLPVFTNAGMAIIHPFFTRDGANLREEWAKYLVSLGGSPNGDAGWGLCKKAYVPAELKTTLRQLKERHDYNNILARGKLAEYV